MNTKEEGRKKLLYFLLVLLFALLSLNLPSLGIATALVMLCMSVIGKVCWWPTSVIIVSSLAGAYVMVFTPLGETYPWFLMPWLGLFLIVAEHVFVLHGGLRKER